MSFRFVTAEAPEDNGEFALIPRGTAANMQAIDVEDRDKPEDAKRTFAFTFEILDGEFSGRRVWVDYILVHPNDQTVEIAYREMGKFCRAINVAEWNDPSELLYKPFLGKIGIKKGNNGYQDKNSISAYSEYGAAATQRPPQAQPAQRTTSAAPAQRSGAPNVPGRTGAPAAAGSRPWGNRAA